MTADNPRQRLMILYGQIAVESLKDKHVMIAGLGGVGSYAVEAVARSFVGNITIADFDIYDITNLNRQLNSVSDKIGLSKADIVKEHILSINPDANVVKIKEKLDIKNIGSYVTDNIDFVIDAIDDVPAKIALIEHCHAKGIRIICSMGTGNKTHPEMLQISDIHKTSVCPLAKKLRREMKDRNIKKLPVVYSTEEIIKSNDVGTIGSTAFVPGTAGLLLASYVINSLISDQNSQSKG